MMYRPTRLQSPRNSVNLCNIVNILTPSVYCYNDLIFAEYDKVIQPSN